MTRTQTPSTLAKGREEWRPTGEPLSEREIEILDLMAKGISYGDISTTLGLSVNTVKAHCKKLYRKLGARNGPHAVSIAIGWRIIFPSGPVIHE